MDFIKLVLFLDTNGLQNSDLKITVKIRSTIQAHVLLTHEIKRKCSLKCMFHLREGKVNPQYSILA